MAQLAVPLAIGSTAVSVGSSVLGGQQAQKSSQFQAAQADRNADLAEAQGARAAAEEKRKARLASSRALAVSAAQGGGVAYDQIGDIEAEGEYRALMALYEGRTMAQQQNLQADALRFEGRQSRVAGAVQGTSTLLRQGASFAEKYG